MSLILGLAVGCGDDEDKKPDFYNSQASNQPAAPKTAAATPTPAVEAEPEAAAEPTPEPGPPVDLGDGLEYRTVGEVDASKPAVAEGELAKFNVRFVALDTDHELFKGVFAFRVGSGQGIAGLDRGVRGMHVGEMREITIPAALTTLPTGVPMPGVEPGTQVRALVTLMELTPKP